MDVYRMIEFALPGILANRSAELGGAPIAIPDMRRQPFTGTHFWDAVKLPDADPPAWPYRAPMNPTLQLTAGAGLERVERSVGATGG